MTKNTTQHNILLAAIDLFSRSGYKAVSIQQIAEAVGIRASSIHNYYPTKSELFDSALDFAEEFLVPYAPSQGNLAHKLQHHTPQEILMQHVTHWKPGDAPLRSKLHRLLFMEQYNNSRCWEIAYKHFISRPANSVAYTLAILQHLGAVPSSDHYAISTLWNQTTLIYGFRQALGDYVPQTVHSFWDTSAFMAFIAARGVKLLPMNLFRDITLHSPSPYPPVASNTRRTILLSAYRLFSMYGSENVSIRKIGAEAGIRGSSIYNYFSSREEIVASLTDHIILGDSRYGPSEHEMLAALQARDPSQIAHCICRFSPNLQLPYEFCGYRFVVREQYTNPRLADWFWRQIEADIQTLTQYLDLAMEQGLIFPCSSLNIAIAAIYMLVCTNTCSTLNEQMHAQAAESRARLMRLLVSLLLNGYRT